MTSSHATSSQVRLESKTNQINLAQYQSRFGTCSPPDIKIVERVGYTHALNNFYVFTTTGTCEL